MQHPPTEDADNPLYRTDSFRMWCLKWVELDCLQSGSLLSTVTPCVGQQQPLCCTSSACTDGFRAEEICVDTLLIVLHLQGPSLLTTLLPRLDHMPICPQWREGTPNLLVPDLPAASCTHAGLGKILKVTRLTGPPGYTGLNALAAP